MSGNAEEWCWDWESDGPGVSDDVNPRGPSSGKYKHVRGGSCNYSRSNRLAIFSQTLRRPDDVSEFVGFRVVRGE